MGINGTEINAEIRLKILAYKLNPPSNIRIRENPQGDNENYRMLKYETSYNRF